MPDLTELIDHWGYGAIFLIVVLGNVGLPVPEETILLLAGYLVWRRTLRLSLVLTVGVVSAAAGDNLGYWIGRRYGSKRLARYSRRFVTEPARFEAMRRFIVPYGPLGGVCRPLPSRASLSGRPLIRHGRSAGTALRDGQPSRRPGVCPCNGWRRVCGGLWAR